MRIRGFRQRSFEGMEFAPERSVFDTLQKKFTPRQSTFLRIALVIIVLVLVGALANLQVFAGAYYKEQAERNRVRTKEIKALRGIIYDVNGTALVENKPQFNLLVTPFDLYQNNFSIPELLSMLENEFGDDANRDATREALKTYSYVPLILQKNIPYEKGITLIPIIQDLPGVFLEETFEREYTGGNTFSHLLGYTSSVSQENLEDDYYSPTDIIGKLGVERSMEHRLRGTKGERSVQVDSLGKEDKLLSFTPSRKGHDITLTIDLELQQKLTEILVEHMHNFDVNRAAGIILDPRDGSLRALVSLPQFDNNIFTTSFDEDSYNALLENPHKPLFNRAISGEYPPGSTFKLVVGASALEEEIVDKYFTVLSTGGITVGNWFYPDWLRGGHGIVDMQNAIAWSVNTYFYTIGGGFEDTEGLGLLRITDYASKFNLGYPTGIELTGEAPGLLPSEEWKIQYKNEPWYLGDTYHISIGQGDILVTPLQVALWTSFFANGGTLYKPHIIEGNEEIIDKNFISSHNIEIIRNGLRSTIAYGSARSLNSLPVEIAGKTGSAQFAQSKKPHGWFTAFAPYEEPELVVTILMEEGDGSESAVPVARDFFNWYFGKNES